MEAYACPHPTPTFKKHANDFNPGRRAGLSVSLRTNVLIMSTPGRSPVRLGPPFLVPPHASATLYTLVFPPMSAPTPPRSVLLGISTFPSAKDYTFTLFPYCLESNISTPLCNSPSLKTLCSSLCPAAAPSSTIRPRLRRRPRATPQPPRRTRARPGVEYPGNLASLSRCLMVPMPC